MRITLPLYLVVLSASAFVYPFWGASRGAVLFGNLAQILALAVGAVNLKLVTAAYGPNDTPRKAWTGFQYGMWIWVVAQIFELRDEFFLGEASYGSMVDGIWLIGYLPLLSGVSKLIGDFRSTGLPLGSRASYSLQCIVLLGLYAVLFYLFIWELIVDPNRETSMKVLDLGYPTMDFLLIVGASILLRFSWAMKGGMLGTVWLLLCVGLVLLGIADFLLANLPSIESASYRMLDVFYFSSYFLIALAARYQGRIARG